MDSKVAARQKPINVGEMFPEVNDIADAKLRAAVIAVWEELWAMSDWEDVYEVPASPEIPYPTIPHNQSVMAMALAVADAFERYHKIKVDRDILIASAILQDASKVVEMTRGEGGKLDSTELGRQYPHAFWAAHLAIKHGIPDTIVNVILNHTPQSPKFPTSLEGKILYYVDQIDVIGIYKDRWRKELFITK